MIASWPHPDVQGYVNVDGVGGIALYNTWEQALEGTVGEAIELAAPSGSYRVSLDITNRFDDRFIAQVTKYTISTTRQLEDVTVVGAHFRESVSTLAGGVGSIELLWDISSSACDDCNDAERAFVLHRLAMRQQAGASFRGIFLLKREFEQPLDVVLSERYAQNELFYEADCQILSAQATVDINDLIRSSIEFQTTGPIQLKYSPPLNALLLEPPGTDKVLTEGDNPIYLEFLE